MTDDDDGTRDVAAALANLPLVDARGRAVNLSSGSDSPRPLLVACFTRDDCGACRAFAPRVVALAAARRDACDVVLIACDANNGYECVDRAVEASGTRDETLRAAEAREGDASYSRARETNFKNDRDHVDKLMCQLISNSSQTYVKLMSNSSHTQFTLNSHEMVNGFSQSVMLYFVKRVS